MIVGKVQAELKVIIPDEVRDAPRLRESDEQEFATEDGEVHVRRVPRPSRDPFENPFLNSTEWDSEEDREAFAHLRR